MASGNLRLPKSLRLEFREANCASRTPQCGPTSVSVWQVPLPERFSWPTVHVPCVRSSKATISAVQLCARSIFSTWRWNEQALQTIVPCKIPDQTAHALNATLCLAGRGTRHRHQCYRLVDCRVTISRRKTAHRFSSHKVEQTYVHACELNGTPGETIFSTLGFHNSLCLQRVHDATLRPKCRSCLDVQHANEQRPELAWLTQSKHCNWPISLRLPQIHYSSGCFLAA